MMETAKIIAKNSQMEGDNHAVALVDMLKKTKEICAIRDIDKANKPQYH